jgi:hypothetical protein
MLENLDGDDAIWTPLIQNKNTATDTCKKNTHTQPMQYGWVQLAVKKQKNGSEGLERKYVHE